MKRFLALLLVLVFGLTLFTACSSTKSTKDNNNTKNSNESSSDSNAISNVSTEDADTTTDTGNKLTGEIEKITDFSNGLAIVKIKGNNEKNYCINKKGNIVFETEALLFGERNYPGMTTLFQSGLIMISEFQIDNGFKTIYYTNGECAKAEDFGVSAFFPDALKDGYILTFTDGKSGAKDKIGILDLALNWIVEPSEALAKTLDITYITVTDELAPYYKDFVLYGYNGSIDVRNGNILSETYRTHGKKIAATFSENWYPGEKGYYAGNPYEKQLMLDTSKIGYEQPYGFCTVQLDGIDFIDGISPLAFSNNSSWIRFSLIDTTGNLLFDAIDFGENIAYIKASGNYVIVIGDHNKSSQSRTVKTFTLSGELVAEAQLPISGIELAEPLYSFEDEVLIAKDANYNILLYGVDLKPLF